MIDSLLSRLYKLRLFFRRSPETVIMLLMVIAALIASRIPDENNLILLVLALLFWAGALLWKLEKTRFDYIRRLREWHGCQCKPYQECPEGTKCQCECHWIIDMDG